MRPPFETRRDAGGSREPPYARYALLNPYNLSLFFGGVALGLLTEHTWLLVITCAAETLWMILAPDSRLLRALWFDRAFDAAERLARAERRQAKLAMLTPEGQMRLGQLCGQKEVIERLANDNPSLAVDLLRGELAKLDDLLEDFVDLAITAGRAERHVASFDLAAMQRSWSAHRAVVERHGEHDPRREIAGKNLAVLEQRKARHDDLCRTIQVTRGQMELVEHTFQLLGDEILTMGSPRELGGRLDELRVALDAVRETADETFGERDSLDDVDALRVEKMS